MSVEDRLDRVPTAWRPDEGDRLIGTVVEVGERESRYGGTYPLVVVATDAGEELVVHAYHTVLMDELSQQRPRRGDRIGMAYLGRDAERGYERYRVVVEHGEETDAEPDWNRYAAEAAAELGEEEPS
ncbi:MAG: hypothetical protein ACRELC_04175 [Gemmatimonadota bacterium]